MLNVELDGLLKKLISQWNIAERRIKKAEQVRGQEVVTPAILELRYAGRKFIDALLLILEKDWKKDPEAFEAIRRFLEEAIENCVKAKHDAIDAMLDFVVTWLNEAESTIGPDKLQSIFPEYIDVTGKIVAAQDKIAQSREDRGTSKDAVYDELEQNEYNELLKLYNKMRVSKARVQAVANISRKKQRLNLVITVVSALVAVGLLLFEIFRHFYS